MVHARWLKLNDRLLVRLEDGQGADHGNNAANGQPKPMVEIDGQAYNLRTYPKILIDIPFNDN